MKMLELAIRICVLSLGLSYATPTSPCQKLQQTQLTSLNERMNQMIEALYSSSIFSKPKTSSTENSSETTNGPEYASNSISYESPFYSSAYPLPIIASSTPQVIYVSPQPPPGLAYSPPLPAYSPITLPSPTIPNSYYSAPGTSITSSEYSYPVPTHYPWPQTHSYEMYSKPPQVPPMKYSPPPLPPPPITPMPVPSPPVTSVPFSPPPLPYSPVYSYPSTTPTYEYKYSYPEYPPPTAPSYPQNTYQSNLSQPPYSQVPEHPLPPPFYGYPTLPMPSPAYPATSHSPYMRSSELIPIPPPYI